MRLLVLILVIVVVAQARHFSHGGHGARAARRIDYEAVWSCVFSLVDVNHDLKLSHAELTHGINRWVSTTEQALDGLSPHTLMAHCDTDDSGSISWAEARDPAVRCLTLAQMEGLAKWLCSRAKHGDFAFDEWTALQDTIQKGIVEGKGLKSIKNEFMALERSQTEARRAALARQHNVPRLSDELDGLVSDASDFITQPLALVIAIFIVAAALLVACIV